mgnify:CR=1 FL=1
MLNFEFEVGDILKSKTNSNMIIYVLEIDRSQREVKNYWRYDHVKIMKIFDNIVSIIITDAFHLWNGFEKI